MSPHTVVIAAAAVLGLFAGNAMSQHVAPSALLTVDLNRATVIDRIVAEWGDQLTASSAGISAAQLREILSGLRSDHLLAASLAGSVGGLRDVVSGALVRSDAAVSATRVRTKSLGDTSDDLVYTPVVPCRIVDTRLGGGGVFAPQTQRDWLAFSPGGFAAQGGSATNCGIPVRPVAVMLNSTLANTVGGPEFFTLWPFGQTLPNASTVNWWGPAQQPANAEIVPLCSGTCTADFSAYASGQTQAIIDVLGYFNRPTNYIGTHVITGAGATDSGGSNNTASGDFSTVAGGYQNRAGTGSYSTVGGGVNNTASNNYSTVAGGFGNTASGHLSTVAGGSSNIASGNQSFAAGILATADATGCFAFANWSSSASGGCLGTPYVARFLLDHGFSVEYFSRRPDGGGTRYVYIGDVVGGQTIATWTGAYLSDVGVWTNNSDVNHKTGFAGIDPRKVLARVASMPIRSWRYAGEDTSKRHIGPMAQDFWTAFRLGDDDKHIGTIDEGGVALAAIQGLNQMMQQKDREIAQLKRKLHAVETKLGM